MTDSQETSLVIQPNASLGVAQAWIFMVGISVVTLAIAGFFAWLGFWPILLYAVLELAVLALAIVHALRGNRYRERLGFEGEVLRVEFGMVGQAPRMRLEMSRVWTQVRVQPGWHRNDPTRLLLTCYGQTLEIGRCLTDEERGRLCARIKELLRPAWRVGIADAGSAAELPLGDS
ncbi:MAG TPA: DUF2244 domain-containing protein [Stenotrophobium sp.]|jgi:uncharacterized membrane protein|nr:DUF2244 domain-containing protein [Stenotrophobium sp.]